MVNTINDKNIKDLNAGENANKEYIKEIRSNFNKENAFNELVEDLKYYYTNDQDKIICFANYDEETLKELIKDTDEQSYYNFDKFTKDEKDYLFDRINENNSVDEVLDNE